MYPFVMYFQSLKTFNYVGILELEYVEIIIVLFAVSPFWRYNANFDNYTKSLNNVLFGSPKNRALFK